jgi:hypothetical protein
LHSRNKPSAQSTSDSQLTGEVGDEGRGEVEDERQGVFEDPINPTKPDSQSPQVPSVEEQGKRFNEKQFGAWEQSTRFNIVAVIDKMLFKSSGLPDWWETLIPFKRPTFRSSTEGVTTSSTNTSKRDWVEEPSWSDTNTAHDNVEREGEWVSLRLEEPGGRRVEA